MKRNIHYLRWIPEVGLIAETLFYWVSSSLLNPIAILLLLLLISLLIFKNRTLAIVLAILFIGLNSYMCLALVSDLVKVTSWTDKTTRMLLIVGTMLGTGLAAAIAMLNKWTRKLPASVQPGN